MPKDTPAKIAPPSLPAAPSWEQLKANPEFLAWHKSPFLRLMTAALRATTPNSVAADPHAMIRDSGVLLGYLGALLTVDQFCEVKDPATEKPKRAPYSSTQKQEE